MVDLDGKVIGDPKAANDIAGIADTAGNQAESEGAAEVVIFAYPLLMFCLCPPIGAKLLYDLIRYGPKRAIREIYYQDRQPDMLVPSKDTA